MTGKPRKRGAKLKKQPPADPTEGAPFDVDPTDDGDIATPKRELDEEEIKEQEGRG
jgi:hypothetical protein